MEHKDTEIIRVIAGRKTINTELQGLNKISIIYAQIQDDRSYLSQACTHVTLAVTITASSFYATHHLPRTPANKPLVYSCRHG